jgi:creatinine amidohydrolase/Fe(II)-dependent formamide hydrolase-like protein
MLAMAPELVRLDKAVADGLQVGGLYRAQRHLTLEGVVPTAWLIDDVSASGVVGDPAGAGPETGKVLVDHWTTQLAEALSEVQAFSVPAGEGVAP